MGDGLTDDDRSVSLEEHTHTEIFESVEPYYLSIGMTLDDYWRGSPRLAVVYREAERMRMERRNLEAWRNGQYMVSALSATVGNMFRKKGTQPIKYLSEPLPLTEKEMRERKERDERIRYERLVEKMTMFAAKTKAQKGGGDNA